MLIRLALVCADTIQVHYSHTSGSGQIILTSPWTLQIPHKHKGKMKFKKPWLPYMSRYGVNFVTLLGAPIRSAVEKGKQNRNC
jgi:hypothetical protein